MRSFLLLLAIGIALLVGAGASHHHAPPAPVCGACMEIPIFP